MKRRRLALVVVIAALLGPAKVLAAEPPALTFEQLVQKGDEARTAHHWAEAVVAYTDALALRPDLTISGRLGLVLIELGEFAAAASQLHHVIEEPAAIASDGERKLLFSAYQQARGKVCRIDVTIDQLGARVDVDGHKVRQGPIDFWFFLEPGAHEIRVSLAGFEDESKPIEAVGGGRMQVGFKLRAKSSPSSARKPDALPKDEPAKNDVMLSKDERPKTPLTLSKDERPNVGGFMLGLGVLGLFGATPGGAIGGQVFGGWRRGWFSFGVEGRAAWGLEAPPGFPSYQVVSYAVAAGPCVHWRLVFGCVLGQASWLDLTYGKAARGRGLGLRFGIEPFKQDHFRVRLWGDLLPRLGDQRVSTSWSVAWVAPPLAIEVGATGLISF